MNEDQKEPTLEESITQVMQTLPPVIRKYLSEGKYTAVAKDLMVKYGLRIDQGGVLEREIMLLLMGIESPDEFTQALVEEARLDTKVVGNITRDINAQIFVPLRKEEMKPTEPTEPTEPMEPAKPAMPMAQPETHFHLQNRIEHPPLPQPPREEKRSQTSLLSATTPPTKTLGDVVRSALATQPAPVKIASAEVKPPQLPSSKLLPKPVEEKLLEDHEEPHIEIDKKTVPPNLPGVVVPSGIIPPGARFSPVIPEVRPSPIIPKVEPQIPPIPEVAAPSTPVAPAPPIKSYSVDPYREPIDGEGV